jgi:putative aldouronate transport system substrate-binding protein
MKGEETMWGSKKRVVVKGVLTILAFSLVLAGCSSSKGSSVQSSSSESPKAEATSKAENKVAEVKPITFSVFVGSPHQQETPDNKIFKLIQDKLGVTFKMEYLVGDVQQKLGVMIAGGDYPDIITGDPKLITAGALIPLEDLIEQYAPNLKKHYAPFWNKMKDVKDGHIYVLPNYGRYYGELTDPYYAGPAFWIQKDILKEMGFPKIKTLDEYFDVIAKYKEKHPTIDGKPTVGFETLAFDWRNWPLENAPAQLSGHPNDGAVNVDNNVAQIYADKDIAKQYYKKLNEINAKGLLDKESFTQNYDQYLAKLSSGRVLGMYDQHWNFGNAEDSLKTQGKDGSTYVGLPIVYDGVKDYYRDRSAINLGSGFGITTKAKDAIRAIQTMDQLLSEDWQKTLQWGIQDQDYGVKDGKFFLTEEQRANNSNDVWKKSNKADGLFGQLPKMEGTFSDGNSVAPGGQVSEYQATLKPIDLEILKGYGFKYYTDFFNAPPENPVYYPSYTIDLVQGSPAQIANTKLNDLQVKMLPKTILAKPENFDSVWQDYTNQIHKLDIKAYEDRMNDQIQYRIKNWSSQ